MYWYPYLRNREKSNKLKCAMIGMSACIIPFVELLMFLFGVFGGMCDVNSCNVFLLLFMTLWVPPISATLFRSQGSADDVACLLVPRA
jgi:hypothetical protein